MRERSLRFRVRLERSSSSRAGSADKVCSPTRRFRRIKTYGKSRSPGDPPRLLLLDLRHRRRPLVGKWKSKPFLIVSGERAVYSVFFLLTLRLGILVYALIAGDFRLAYVASHSNRAMPSATSSPPGGADRKAPCCSGLGCCRLTRPSSSSEPPQVPRHDAVHRRDADGGAVLLPAPDRLRRQPVRGARARARASSMSATATASIRCCSTGRW